MQWSVSLDVDSHVNFLSIQVLDAKDPNLFENNHLQMRWRYSNSRKSLLIDDIFWWSWSVNVTGWQECDFKTNKPLNCVQTGMQLNNNYFVSCPPLLRTLSTSQHLLCLHEWQIIRQCHMHSAAIQSKCDVCLMESKAWQVILKALGFLWRSVRDLSRIDVTLTLTWLRSSYILRARLSTWRLSQHHHLGCDYRQSAWDHWIIELMTGSSGKAIPEPKRERRRTRRKRREFICRKSKTWREWKNKGKLFKK